MKQAGYEVEKSGAAVLAFACPVAGRTALPGYVLLRWGEGYDLKDIMAAIEDGTGRRGAEGCIYAG